MTTHIATNSTGASDAFHWLSIRKFSPVNVTCHRAKRLTGWPQLSSSLCNRISKEEVERRFVQSGDGSEKEGTRKLSLPRPSLLPPSPAPPSNLRDLIAKLKQQRRWRLRKRHLKSEVALLQTLSRLFHLFYFVKCWQMFLKLTSKGLYQSSGKEKESFCLGLTSSTKRERYGRAVMAKKCKKIRDARAKLFCQSKPIAFLPFSLPSPKKNCW